MEQPRGYGCINSEHVPNPKRMDVFQSTAHITKQVARVLFGNGTLHSSEWC